MDSVPTVLTGAYDLRLVVVSIIIAVLAAGAALDLAGPVTWARDAARFWWLTGGAVAMGVGIWSMHYIGMLAFQLPVVVEYDWPTVLLSLLAAVGASWAPPVELEGQRVLMVDDNATNRTVLMGQLLVSGVDPVSAGSAAEALMLMRHAAAVGRPFAAVLLDQHMPDCDGAELGRIILDDETLDSTRMILLTSSAQRGEGQTFADIGFAGYLLKPVAQRDLTDCLMLALAAQAGTWRTQTHPMITRHGLRAQRPAKRR